MTGAEREASLRRVVGKMDYRPVKDDVLFLLDRLARLQRTLDRTRELADQLRAMLDEDDGIVRDDRYTVMVDGHRVRATPAQEVSLRSLTPEQRANFLRTMGRE